MKQVDVLKLRKKNFENLFFASVSNQEIPPLTDDIMKYIVNFKEIHHKQYKASDNEYSWPYTIAPQLVKKYNVESPLDKDLTNLSSDEIVLPSLSIWPNRDERKCRFAESNKRTNDIFFVTSHFMWSRFISDGMNQNGKAVFITSGLERLNSMTEGSKPLKHLHFVYAITQSNTRGTRSQHRNIRPIVEGEGKISSLMLENERNRFTYNVVHGNACTLYVKDLPEDTCLLDAACIPVAELTTDKKFIKTVSLGNDTYLGLTKEGKLYSIWLDDNNVMHYAEQKCLLIKDIAIDNTTVTDRGFHPKVALLTRDGKIYITHLFAHQQIIMYHLATGSSSFNHRLYYHNGKVMVIRRTLTTGYYMAVAENSATELGDNFEFFYFYSLFKKMALQ